MVKVTTADEMRQAVLERMKEATLVIKAAAVADYRPVNVSEQKLKRTGPLTLELAPTEDILAEVVRRRRPGQLIVGFAAETENRMENGRAKLLRKGADAIVVNDVSGEADRHRLRTSTPPHSSRHPRPSNCPRCPSANLPTASSTRSLHCAGRKPLMVEVEGDAAAGKGAAANPMPVTPRRQLIVE